MEDLYLIHYGTPGMKWGVRRYQNEDGSYKSGAKGRYTESTVNRHANRLKARAAGNRRQAEMYKAEGKIRKSNKYTNKARINDIKAKAAQNQTDKNVKSNQSVRNYQEQTSKGKNFVTNLLLKPAGAQTYQMARSYGEGRVKSLVRSMLDINGARIAGIAASRVVGNGVAGSTGDAKVGKVSGMVTNYGVQTALKDKNLSLQQRALARKYG